MELVTCATQNCQGHQGQKQGTPKQSKEGEEAWYKTKQVSAVLLPKHTSEGMVRMVLCLALTSLQTLILYTMAGCQACHSFQGLSVKSMIQFLLTQKSTAPCFQWQTQPTFKKAKWKEVMDGKDRSITKNQLDNTSYTSKATEGKAACHTLLPLGLLQVQARGACENNWADKRTVVEMKDQARCLRKGQIAKVTWKELPEKFLDAQSTKDSMRHNPNIWESSNWLALTPHPKSEPGRQTSKCFHLGQYPGSLLLNAFRRIIDYSSNNTTVLCVFVKWESTNHDTENTQRWETHSCKVLVQPQSGTIPCERWLWPIPIKIRGISIQGRGPKNAKDLEQLKGAEDKETNWRCGVQVEKATEGCRGIGWK